MAIRTGEQINIAMAYMTLEVIHQGLGTCWITSLSKEDVHQIMDLPDELFVHALLAVVYPEEDPAPRPRKPVDEIVFWEKYAW
jgi:nitroreductase